MKRRPNLQILLEGSGLIAVGGVITILTLTRRYLMWVSPRLQIPLILFGLFMFGLGVFTLKDLYRPRYKQRTAYLIWLVIPLMLLIFPPLPLSKSSDAFGLTMPSQTRSEDAASPSDSKNEVQTNQTESGNLDIPPELAAFLEEQKKLAPSSKTQGTDATLADDQSATQATKSEPPQTQQSTLNSTVETGVAGEYITYAFGSPKTLHGYDGQSRHIDISDLEFYPWLCEMFLHPAMYSGFTVTINAQVYRDPELTQDGEFLASRLLMTCCAADVVPTGIFSRFEGADQLADGRWVSLQGEVILDTYEGNTIPVISVTSWEDGERPTEPYVYPF